MNILKIGDNHEPQGISQVFVDGSGRKYNAPLVDNTILSGIIDFPLDNVRKNRLRERVDDYKVFETEQEVINDIRKEAEPIRQREDVSKNVEVQQDTQREVQTENAMTRDSDMGTGLAQARLRTNGLPVVY